MESCGLRVVVHERSGLSDGRRIQHLIAMQLTWTALKQHGDVKIPTFGVPGEYEF